MKRTLISGLIVFTGIAASAKPGESAVAPLDWRYHQFEPAAPVLGRNPLAGAKLTVSGQWSTFGPEMVVDGDISSSSHWACEELPAVLTVELQKPEQLGYCQIWLYQPRVYKFFIEASPDGRQWQRVADWTENEKPADVVGDPSRKTWSATAWRNERVNGQFVLWSSSLTASSGSSGLKE